MIHFLRSRCGCETFSHQNGVRTSPSQQIVVRGYNANAILKPGLVISNKITDQRSILAVLSYEISRAVLGCRHGQKYSPISPFDTQKKLPSLASKNLPLKGHEIQSDHPHHDDQQLPTVNPRPLENPNGRIPPLQGHTLLPTMTVWGYQEPCAFDAAARYIAVGTHGTHGKRSACPEPKLPLSVFIHIVCFASKKIQ